MIEVCKYDEKRDLGLVVEGLDVDLNAAIESGVVLDTGTTGVFNDIDDPNGIWCRVSDCFEAMDIQRGLINKIKSSSANKASSSPVAAASSDAKLSTE